MRQSPASKLIAKSNERKHARLNARPYFRFNNGINISKPGHSQVLLVSCRKSNGIQRNQDIFLGLLGPACLFFRYTYHHRHPRSLPSHSWSIVAFCLTRLYLPLYVVVSANTVTGQRLFLSLIARTFGVTGARSRVPESISTRVEDTATIPVATSSSGFSLPSLSSSLFLSSYRPYFVSFSLLLLLVFLSLFCPGDPVLSVCSTHTRQRKRRDREREREREREPHRC